MGIKIRDLKFEGLKFEDSNSEILSGHERNVLLDLAREITRQDAELQFQRPTVSHFVIKDRVRDQMIHARLIGHEKLSAPGGVQIYCAPGAHEIFLADHAIVDRSEHAR